MTTSVVTVDRITPYKEIARLLTEHRISGVPVLTMGGMSPGWSPKRICSPRESAAPAAGGAG